MTKTEDFAAFVSKYYGIEMSPVQKELFTQIQIGRNVLYQRVRSAGMTTLSKAYKEFVNGQK